jgi:F0F1-type ATP synthase gamma subunit
LAERVPKRSRRLQDLLSGHKNGKTVCVLLTSNSSFYGGLDEEVVEFFVSKTKGMQADVIVAGSTGKRLLTGRNYQQKYEYIQFKKDSADSIELQALAKRVFEYSQVLVYYTKFVTLLDQQPTFTDLMGMATSQELQSIPNHYILEPEIDVMLEFFEGQILILLFQSIFIDVEIAHLAARMIAMNQAENSAEKAIDTQLKRITRLNRQLQDRQSINTYNGLFKGVQ